MKPLPFKIPYGSKASIKVDHEQLPHFYPSYHTHEEIQLTLIIRSNGTAYIGDRIIEFSEGEIFLLGQQLPHVFKDKHTGASGVESISIFFLRSFLGDKFLEIPESTAISKLISNAKRGLRWDKTKASEPGKLIVDIDSMKGIQRIIHLLKALYSLSLTPYEFITGPDYQKPRRQADGQKINDVFNYLTGNYEKDISLAEIADIAHMSPTAFCRYFKQHTRKSFSRFLNEIRVGQACKLLHEKPTSVSEVAFASGFNNLSNFNRQFKKVTGTTPTEYQKLAL